MFTISLFILFLFVASICLFDREKTAAVRYTYLGVGVLLFLFAAFKPMGVDPDSPNYLTYYYGGGEEIARETMEFTFVGIIAIAKNYFGGPQGMFILYALLAVPLRAYAITKNTDLWLISLLVWMSNFYILHDLTQIRVSVSAGLFMWGLWFLSEGRRREYLLMALLAICFHYSSIVLLGLVFFGNKPLNTTWRYILAITPLLGYAIHLAGIDPLTFLPIPFLQDKMELYEELRDSGIAGDKINIFNIVYLLKLLAYYILLWKYNLVEKHTRNFPLLMKLYAISYFSFTAFAFLPVIAFRISELIGVVEIILIPYIAYTVRPLSYGKVIAIAFAFGCFTLNIFYNNLLKFI